VRRRCGSDVANADASADQTCCRLPSGVCCAAPHSSSASLQCWRAGGCGLEIGRLVAPEPVVYTSMNTSSSSALCESTLRRGPLATRYISELVLRLAATLTVVTLLKAFSSTASNERTSVWPNT